MNIVNYILGHLTSRARFSDRELMEILSSEEQSAHLHKKAHEIRLRFKGSAVKKRALIEVNNDCLRNCLYCGIRNANTSLERYSLSPEAVMDAARKAYADGLRTFVLQGGENPELSDEMILRTVRALKKEMPDAAVTLSLGERPYEVYREWRKAGADRYLLRFETYNPGHYRMLHPSNMERDNRLRCLDYLASLGYRTGTGFIVGAPGQKVSHLVEDIRFIEKFQPGMIGIGPFIPAENTPFSAERPGNIRQTLNCLSILRLVCPQADIPASTALNTLGGTTARTSALLGGANVVMPNYTPGQCRELYAIYRNKTSL